MRGTRPSIEQSVAPLPPQLGCGRTNHVFPVFKPRGDILLEKQRVVEIGMGGKLSDHNLRCDRQRGSDGASDHDADATLLGDAGRPQCLGEAADLVELDVDKIVSTVEMVEELDLPEAFIRADVK